MPGSHCSKTIENPKCSDWAQTCTRGKVNSLDKVNNKVRPEI